MCLTPVQYPDCPKGSRAAKTRCFHTPGTQSSAFLHHFVLSLGEHTQNVLHRGALVLTTRVTPRNPVPPYNMYKQSSKKTVPVPSYNMYRAVFEEDYSSAISQHVQVVLKEGCFSIYAAEPATQPHMTV